jgi:hypothetical protein
MDLWKYGQILTIQKFINHYMVKVFKEKIPHMSLSSCITLYIEFQ